MTMNATSFFGRVQELIEPAMVTITWVRNKQTERHALRFVFSGPLGLGMPYPVPPQSVPGLPVFLISPRCGS